ncbi:MAG TPA: dockerin type I domain-containing protein, partial [Candidatus Paceibacterota bacterium]
GGVTTTISGVSVPPLLLVDKTEVRKGDFVKIEGKALPGAEVSLFLGDKDEKIKKILTRVFADSAGAYAYSLATAALAQGEYAVLARAEKGETRTTLSQEVSFAVGLQNKAAPLFSKAPAHVDFNKDNKVNLVDFSIAAFWFKKPTPPAHVDPNKDGKVDLKDFSMLAYYWTG